MVITYAGGHCFKLSAGDTTIALNPPSSKSSLKVSKFGADIVLISAQHPDWDGVETATHAGKEPFVIRGPGAYEVGDVVVTGYASPGSLGDGAGDFQNTIYLIRFDGMYILVLGALSSAKLPQEARADLTNVGIIFTPVGGETLGAKEAHELSVSLEPKLTIPYQVGSSAQTGKGDGIQAFLKAEGATDVKPIEKLTLRAKELAAMEGDIAIFK